MPADAPAADTQPANAPSAAPTRLVVERIVDDRVIGWAFDPGAPGAERLVLMYADRRFTPTLQRQPRDDVSRSLGVAGLALGFEFRLPGADWTAGLPPGLPLLLSLNGAPPVPVGGAAPPAQAARVAPGHIEGWHGLHRRLGR
jgi:hypothetical protein